MIFCYDEHKCRYIVAKTIFTGEKIKELFPEKTFASFAAFNAILFYL
jgi:hypothetical protein